MWNRTITVGSFGKSFSVTGWRIGWAIGPSHLISPLNGVTVCTTGHAPTILQEAAAGGLERESRLRGLPESYFSWFSRTIERNCAKLSAAFSDIGCVPLKPEGGFFLLVDTAPMNWTFEGEEYGLECVKWLTVECKLAVLPLSVFYGVEKKSLAGKCIRVCCAKSDQTIEMACTVIRSLMKTSP
eukprot:sb/3471492/